MSGVAVIIELLLANAALAESVEAENIVGDDLPDDSGMPAISVHQVASVDRKVLKAGAVVRVTDRVEAMIHARDASTRDLVARLVKRACADKIGDYADVTAVSVLTEGQGADFTGETGLRLRMQEFRVSYNEATGQAVPSFDPASLFAASEVGVWYDPSDLASMFQDATGTIPAAVGSPVGRINDKSGGNRHATQGTSSARPMLRKDGDRFYLEFDGIDDYLRATFTITNPFTRISAIRQITWTDSDRIFGAAAVASNGELFQRTASPQIALVTSASSVAANNASAAVGADAVVSEYFNAAGQTLTVNNGTATTGIAGLATPGGITIAATRFAGNAGNFRLYSLLMIGRGLTIDETADMRTYAAGKGGVTL